MHEINQLNDGLVRPFATGQGVVGLYPEQDRSFDQPCYSLQLSQPFLRLLRRYDGFPTKILDDLERLETEDRLPVVSAHRLLQSAVEITDDPDLGLKAAREINPGDTGILDYLMSTAATVQEALNAVRRYKRLINDTIDFRLQIEGEHVIVRVENTVVMPKAALDFELAFFYRIHLRRWPRTTATGYEVCFPYSKPGQISEHELTFPGAVLTFSAPYAGFVIAASDLNEPLQTADPKLYAVMQRHAELTLVALPRAQSITEKVRDFLVNGLSNGGPYAKRISRQLNISPRTLIRKLEREGTTFKELLDDVRKQLALTYLGNRDLDLSQIAFQLGFSHATALHRAFRRWTGQTPLEYRRSRRRS